MSKETIRLRPSLRSALRRDALVSLSSKHVQRIATAKFEWSENEDGRSAGLAFFYSMLIVSIAAWAPVLMF